MSPARSGGSRDPSRPVSPIRQFDRDPELSEFVWYTAASPCTVAAAEYGSSVPMFRESPCRLPPKTCRGGRPPAGKSAGPPGLPLVFWGGRWPGGSAALPVRYDNDLAPRAMPKAARGTNAGGMDYAVTVALCTPR